MTEATGAKGSQPEALVRIESVTVRDFRGLTHCTLVLEPALTLLIGRNSAGKSRLLRAVALACGSASADVDDFTVGSTAVPTIDLVLAPAGVGAQPFDAAVATTFGSAVQLISADAERIAWRTTVQRSAEGWGGRVDSRFLRYDVGAAAWVLPQSAPSLNREQRGALAADLVDTGRDLAAELTRRSSAIRRVLGDLDVPEDERGALETDLERLSARIVGSSGSLAAVRARLAKLEQAVEGIGVPLMSPLPARLEELARTIEIALDTGTGGLPMRLQGAGARSLASLQVQSVFYERRLGRDGSDLPTHPVTLVEEPEAHLHPQACFDLVGLLQQVTGQVIVSTHSSHLVTTAPTETLRLVRCVDGETVVRDLNPVDAAQATPAALRVDVGAAEWEKIKRSVERPFGELLFAHAVVVGDGASERAFLPPLLRHALGHAAAGVCVVDPESLGQAHPVVKFAEAAGIPCVLFCDADKAGHRADSQLPSWATRVWVTGDQAVDGDLEDVLSGHDEDWCLEHCAEFFPNGQGSGHERLDQLKGTYGGPLGRAFVQKFPDVKTWPKGFQELVRVLLPAVTGREAGDG